MHCRWKQVIGFGASVLLLGAGVGIQLGLSSDSGAAAVRPSTVALSRSTAAVTAPRDTSSFSGAVGTTAAAPTPDGLGFWTVTGSGAVTTQGTAPFFGDASTYALNAAIVGIAPTADGKGYWLLGADGGVFSYGDAHFWGSTGNLQLNSPALQMVSTPDSRGYWFVAADGGIFAFGDATFHGSMGGQPLNQPVVGMAATASGAGYWLVASDGGIFAFGDATFLGSTGNITLNEPVVSMAANWDGAGYWLVAADGGIFAFGDAAFQGSAVGSATPGTVVSIVVTGDAGGYWIIGNDGSIYDFGDAATTGGGDVLSNEQPIDFDPSDPTGDVEEGTDSADGVTYTNAIYMSVGGSSGICQNDKGVMWADFNLGRAWSTLKGTVAISDHAASGTALSYRLYVDGTLKQSGSLVIGQSAPISVPLNHALRVRLWMYDPNTATDESLSCGTPYLVWGNLTMSH